MSSIDPEVLARSRDWAREFREAAPFRHVVIPGFLDPLLAQQLLQSFPRFEDRYALNEMGDVGGKAVRMDVRELSPAYRQLDACLQSREFLDFVSQVTGISDLLYDPDYIVGGTHENRDGQSLDAHVDFNYHPRTKWHRRLNLIVYLNREWEDGWGGTLDLHSDPWTPQHNRTVRVAPLFNHAVIFETTETSWHGFSAITLPHERKNISRKSFAVYLYTRERPPAETAPPHATIYVPDAMPPNLREGAVLDAAAVADLQGRFTRLRTQMRYLYEREKQFGAQIAVLEHAVAEMRAEQKIGLQGYAVQNGIAGMWSDGWVGREASLRFTPARPMRGIALDVWIPAGLPEQQRLQVVLDGRHSEHILRTGVRSRVEIAMDAPAGKMLELRIAADAAWTPSSDGTSTDDRALAYRLIGAELRHDEGLPLSTRVLRRIGLR